MSKFHLALVPILLACFVPAVASAQVTVYSGGGSFDPQCPQGTIRHPVDGTGVNKTPLTAEVPYTGPVTRTVTHDPSGKWTYSPPLTIVDDGGAIKCQQISGGDGMMTEADGNQTFMFSFGPLSGMNAIENGAPGTQYAATYAKPYCDPNRPNYNSGQPNPYYSVSAKACLPGTDPNGAVGFNPPGGFNFTASTSGAGLAATVAGVDTTGAITAFTITAAGTGYPAPACNVDTAICTGEPFAVVGGSGSGATADVTGTITTTGAVTSVAVTGGGTGYVAGDAVTFTFSLPPAYSAGADNAAIMNTGVIDGNIPGPLFAFDEDDEFIMSLTNVGMIMRPDLFEQHTVHFHGYPNASSFYDGVPDATIAINIGGTFAYYYFAPDAGTYFWHCHITPPEHIQMGMAAWLYVRPRQNRIPDGTDPYVASTSWEEADPRTACPDTGASYVAGSVPPDILCSAPQPAKDVGFVHHSAGSTAWPAGYKYIYDDGDGSTRYDIDVPLQIHGFDPNFHMVGMTFNPEGFADMHDKYFLLNGRSYPDTVDVNPSTAVLRGQTLPANWAVNANWTGGVAGTCVPGVIPNQNPPNPNPCTNAQSTTDTDTQSRPSQPASALIVLSASGGPPGTCGVVPGGTTPVSPCGQKAALRIDNLSVTEYVTLESVGIPMLFVGYQAKILRDQAGNNLFIKTNSITIGGGESLDAILDSTGIPSGTYFLYSPQLDHLANDAENFGGMMTEVVITP